MDSLETVGGIAGLSAALLLVLFGVLSRLARSQPWGLASPSVVFHIVAQRPGPWAASHGAAALASVSSILFSAGLAVRLWQAEPWLAAAQLALAVLGLGAYVIDAMVAWFGTAEIVRRRAAEARMAEHAYLAVHAVRLGLFAAGTVQIGLALLAAGTAIVLTAGIPVILGLVGMLAGFLALVGVAVPGSRLVFQGWGILTLVWLAWGGRVLLR